MSIFAQDAFRHGNRFAVSFEVFPARSPMQLEGLARLMRLTAGYRPRFVSVTYGAGGTTREASLATIAAMAGAGQAPIAGHLTCVEQSRAQTWAMIDEYARLGLRHIVALRGDPPAGAAGYRPHPDGFADAAELTGALARRGGFDISVGAYPEKHPDSGSLAACVDNLKRKLDAGADRAITQFFFDNAAYFRFLELVRARGIHQPVVPGILLVHDFAKVRGFAERCGTAVPVAVAQRFEGLAPFSDEHVRETAAFAAEQILTLAAQGVDHFHIYTLNRADLVEATCRLIGLHAGAPALTA